MPSIFDIADHILATSDVGLSHRELQKMLYLAQGFYLAQTGEELFPEDFAAWKFGPVHSGVFQKYKGYGYHYIERPPAEVLVPLNTTATTFLVGLVLAFNTVGQNNLIEYSHADVPWSAKYIPGSNAQLSKSDLREYFINFDTFDEYKLVAGQKVQFHCLIEDRLKYLKRLPQIGDSWISGGAEVPSEQACDLASRFLSGFERYLFASAAKPIIPKLIMGPLPRGGVSVEFYSRNATFLHFKNDGVIEIEAERDGLFSDKEVPMEQFDEDFSEYYGMLTV